MKIETWMFTRKPEWLKDFKPNAKVSQAEAIDGFFANARPMRHIPGPTKPMDYSKDKQKAMSI